MKFLVFFVGLFCVCSVTCSGHGKGHEETTTQKSAQSHGGHGANPSPTVVTTMIPKLPLITDENAAKLFLEDLNNQATSACQNRAMKDWNYSTNITAYNRAQAVNHH